MEPIILTNLVMVLTSFGTNLICGATVYPNSTNPPYIIHHPQVVTQKAVQFTFEGVEYRKEFRADNGPIDTNTQIVTPFYPVDTNNPVQATYYPLRLYPYPVFPALPPPLRRQ